MISENIQSTNSTLIQGKKIKRYGKYILCCVLYYNVQNNKDIHDKEKYEKLKSVIANVDTSKDIEDIYEGIMKKLSIETPEGLLSYLFYIYKPGPDDLIYKTFNTFCGIRSLTHLTDWFDNFRLNGICSSHNLIMYNNYDKDGVYTVDRPFQNNINKKVELDYDRVVKLLVGPLRSFIISNNLYQSNDEYKIPKSFITKSNKEICDECYIHYPFYYGGSHGWDVLFIKDMSLTLNEIYKFTCRYPNAIVGYVMNIATYQSNSGKHWVALCFKNKCCYMICSAGSDFFVFDSYNYNSKQITLNELLNSQGFGMNYNSTVIQKDNHSCGMFSCLSLYLMMCYDCDISKTVKRIGVNAANIVDNKNIDDFVKIFAGSTH